MESGGITPCILVRHYTEVNGQHCTLAAVWLITYPEKVCFF